MKLYFNLLLIMFTANLAKAVQVDTIHYDKESITHVAQNISRTSDAGFNILLHHAKKIDAVMGKSYAEDKVMLTIMQDDSDAVSAAKKSTEGLTKMTMGNKVYYIPPSKTDKQPVTPDWNVLYHHLKVKYGHQYADRVTRDLQTNFYSYWGLNVELAHSLVEYFKRYPDDLQTSELNAFAWDVFDYSDNKGELKTALKWSKLSLSDSNNTMLMDTYANLLYKLGRKQDAINEETAALMLAPTDNGIKQTIEKMKSNQQTWHK